MEQNEEFTVRDRRRPDAEPAKETSSADAAPGPEPARNAGQDAGEQQALPDVDFATFVLSLATSAQISLGAIPHPETNLTATHLPAAKQMIDVLGMLQEKTRGNLTKDEATLLEQVLYSLRMHFVRASAPEKKTGGS